MGSEAVQPRAGAVRFSFSTDASAQETGPLPACWLYCMQGSEALSKAWLGCGLEHSARQALPLTPTFDPFLPAFPFSRWQERLWGLEKPVTAVSSCPGSSAEAPEPVPSCLPPTAPVCPQLQPAQAQPWPDAQEGSAPHWGGRGSDGPVLSMIAGGEEGTFPRAAGNWGGAGGKAHQAFLLVKQCCLHTVVRAWSVS